MTEGEGVDAGRKVKARMRGEICEGADQPERKQLLREQGLGVATDACPPLGHHYVPAWARASVGQVGGDVHVHAGSRVALHRACRAIDGHAPLRHGKPHVKLEANDLHVSCGMCNWYVQAACDVCGRHMHVACARGLCMWHGAWVRTAGERRRAPIPGQRPWCDRRRPPSGQRVCASPRRSCAWPCYATLANGWHRDRCWARVESVAARELAQGQMAARGARGQMSARGVRQGRG